MIRPGPENQSTETTGRSHALSCYRKGFLEQREKVLRKQPKSCGHARRPSTEIGLRSAVCPHGLKDNVADG